MNPTPANKVNAVLAVVGIINDSIVAAGPQGISEGMLYAALMSIDGFRVEHLNYMLEALEGAGKITRSGFLCRAVL